ncbi:MULTISPECIES: VgrG-related protein [Streptomyces]|uniref:Gp5/Type VI secretion system Vgr protein OB-fold domain-containing protein n=2 Tax=Streptomyces TaxID=1883 RepID=Q9L0P5_STRCO|nr:MULTISPECIES: VgrG-related protein [Streptomyces]MDX2929042.1 VgrG-related protein [Streptomyces sp. NRRL_B-16638]MDX3351012.1 VgrG-related protein [Streptomyces sp. ME02-6979A]MDX3402787.1 VgrG-related protein [Streptomyces sp. ME01-18h]MYU43768.1 VgrG-related protein [Streptomyces sp. SID7813]NSL83270.1 VgrG-related protein [Streptomyces coelicolor]
MVRPSFSSIVEVKIGGAKLPDTIAPMLTDGWVDQGVNVPAAFRLTFRDPYHRLLGDLNVQFGTKVVITPIADGQGKNNPLLTGEVTGLETDYDGTGSFTVIRGYDYGHRLMRQRRVAAYRNQKASDIARKLVQMDGVSVGRIQPTKGTYAFIAQPNVTDWDFLARLADENKMIMYLDSKGKFRFVTPKPSAGAPSPNTDGDQSAFVLQAGHDILRLRAAVTAADQIGKVESRGWNVTTKKKITEIAPATTDPGISIKWTPGTAAGKFKPGKLVETANPYDKQDEVQNAAKALASDVTASFSELEVAANGHPDLRPGVPVALSDVGTPFEGKYTVTSVRHHFGDGVAYESWITVSGRQWRSLYGLASGGGGSDPASATRLPSVANAIVTDVQDPLKQGRVKLQFPWLDDTYVSDWARSVQMGGVAGGGIFPMDVGDEVLVAFDRGALDHPFVIGGLYNGRDVPTKSDVPLHDGLKKKAVRHTLSDRQGNRVDLLSQRTGGRKQGVRIASGNDKLTINLDRTKTEITVDSKGSVSITGSRSVSVDAGTDLSLSARRSLTIKSGGPLSIQGGSTINMRSGGLVGVNAGGALNLGAGGAATLSAGAATTISGTVNVQINSVMTRVIGATFEVKTPIFKVATIPVPGL